MNLRAMRVVALVSATMIVAAACGAAATPSPTMTAAGATPTTPVASAEATPSPTPKPASVKFTLNFLAGGPQAGFMLAKKLGYYDEVGLDVTIQEGQGSGSTATLVATGQTDFGFADAPSAMGIRAKEGKVKIIGPILQTNGFSVMSLEETGITSVSQLVGKKVGVQPGTAQVALLDALFKGNGIDPAQVELVNIDPAALVGSLLQKQVDAILGGADFQAIQIQDRGVKINQQYYRDSGVPTVGLSIIAKDEFLAENPDVAARFVAASLRGWDAARQDPASAAKAVVEQFVSGDEAQILAQLEVDLEFICAPGATALGLVPEANWTTTYDLLTEYLALPKIVPVTDYYSTEYLPADAPACP